MLQRPAPRPRSRDYADFGFTQASNGINYLEDKIPVMFETRNFGTRFRRQARIDFGGEDARFRAAFRKNFAPWAYNQTVAIGVPAVGMKSSLRRCDHESAVLDRPGPQQHVPMCFSGGLGESRWCGESECTPLRHLAIELGKADVVADRKPHTAPWRVRHNGFIAARDGIGLAIFFARGQVHIEEMDLAVTCGDIAIR